MAEPISPLRSPSMETLSTIASSRTSLDSNASRGENEPLRTPRSEGRLPGPEAPGSTLSKLMNRVFRRGNGGAEGAAGHQHEKLAKKGPSDTDPLVLRPNDMQAQMLKFQVAMSFGQVATQVEQDGQQFTNGVNQGYWTNINDVTS